MKKHIITISLISIMLSALCAAGAQAQGPGDLWQSNTGQQAVCRGGRDFGVFLSALTSFDDFTEYWKDITGWPTLFYNSRYTTNYCQYMDIDSLLKRITKVRKQIRDAFYVCAPTAQLKDTYYKLEAELFYLRNYINTNNSAFIVISDQEMMNKMKGYSVIQDNFPSDKFAQLFQELKSKYTTRLDTYKNCKDPSWQNLVDKWNEFKENAGGAGPAIKAASASISKRWERMANTPMKGGQSFFGGFVDAKINGMNAKEGLDLITQELKKNMPQGYTFDALQVAQTVSDENYDEGATFGAYAANYQSLYAETSDEYVKQITGRLDILDKIITETFPYQNQTYQCTRRINNKQC